MTLLGSAPLAYTLEQAREPEAVSRALRVRGVALDAEEVALLPQLLGRPPLWAEAVLFGILWSEHCSYKSTRHLLQRLPTMAPQVVIGPGEDAGVVGLPAPCQDLVLVLAHESHNHPSQVLPVEGAATGVGGIVRDVVCMGATVTGVLDGLRIGDPRSGVATRDIARGVVQGIADYGNALGVPNLGGDVYFDRRFDQNCLVNVMAVGIAPKDGVLRSRVPEGVSDAVFVLVGKPTDDSGFGGAAFASENLTDEDRRAAVQLPDPFLKRVLNVANEAAFARLRARGIPAGFKDLGAGGVACATSEMAAAGGKGARIVLDDVHRVPRALLPEVLLCAETQERYCWAVPEEFASELVAIYEQEFALGEIHPGAGARVIGRATDERRYEVTWQGEVVVDCPVEAITAGRRAPRAAHRRAPAAPRNKLRRPHPEPHGALLQMLASFAGGSREYLYRHYDSEVQMRTWLRPGEGDAVVFVPAPGRALGVALAIGGNPHWCEADPELGARHAVAEASRNVACVGGRPWALTDCLNFGSPEDPEVMGDFEATIEGLSVAAEALGMLAHPGAVLPFVSGNVSLYNQTGSRAIPPSPIVMCAGVVRDPHTCVGLALQSAGAFLVMVGEPRHELTGSLYLREALGEASAGAPPSLDLPREGRLQELAVLAAEGRWVHAAHDVSDGGLAMALAEMLLAAPPEANLGAEIDLGPLECPTPSALFSERPAIVFEVPPERAARLYQAARDRQLLAWPLGTVSRGGTLRIRTGESGTLEWSATELRDAAARPLSRLWNEEIE